VIHNILNEYKAERGYYTIMPTKKELQQKLDTMTFIAYTLDKKNGEIVKMANNNEKEAMIALDMAYEKRKKLEKENEEFKKKIRKLKYDIYEIIGHENYETGYGGADLVEPQYMRDNGWDFPIQN